jgi:hypothetical protein
VAKLASDIMEIAEGVFLWLRLVMDDLVRAHAEGASLREVAQYLSVFPKDLEELYKNIIQRVPQEFRQESYYMLEIVLRTDEQLSIKRFIGCLICAECETLENCIARLQTEISTPLSSDSVIRWLKSRCGGLIEPISSSEYRMAKLQFMHQTVKDFISLPGFQKLITQEDNLIPVENGYSILSKQLLASVLSRLHKMRADPTARWDSREWKRRLWDGRHMLYQAEASTGKSQKLLLDEANSIISLYSEVYTGFLSESFPFNSIISFAVTSNLYLYLQETLQERHCVNSNPTISLLHCAVQASKILASSSRPLGRSDLRREEDFGKMIKLLLSHGADLKATWKGLTPFQLLFRNWYEGLQRYNYYNMPRSMLAVVSALLCGGQDPNEDIMFQVGNDDEESQQTCKALHIANLEMAQLLQCNTNLNALDSRGRTPLDACLSVDLSQLDKGLYHRREEGPLQLILLLIENGACVTRAGQCVLVTFVQALERLGFRHIDLDRIRSAPILTKRRRVVPKIPKILKQKSK